jgi:4-diphosphocytidyl-2-C-methyl-D-erythritol kinase
VPERLAPAKVNLFLHVGAPDASGYHPLCSLMVFADIGDRVSVRSSAEDDPHADFFRADGPFAGNLGGDLSTNLVVRAAEALWGAGRAARPGVSFRLEKQLPVASGLGGGSTDAGAALHLLREQWQLGIDDGELEAVAAGLGADGAACLWGRPVLAEGRGERLGRAPRLPELHAVLVNPGVAVSTPEVYRRLDATGTFGDVAPPTMPDAFESAAELAGWLAAHRNDLEAPAVDVAPEVGAVLATLREEPEALLARVSGSGGTCFALCADDIAAETLAERVEGLAPHWWVRRCRLGGPWA